MIIVPGENSRLRVFLIAVAAIGLTLAILGSILQAVRFPSGPYIRGTGLIFLLLSGVAYVSFSIGNRWLLKARKMENDKTVNKRRRKRSAGRLIIVSRFIGWLVIVSAVIHFALALIGVFRFSSVYGGSLYGGGYATLPFALQTLSLPVVDGACGVLLLCAAEILVRLTHLERQPGKPLIDGSFEAGRDGDVPSE